MGKKGPKYVEVDKFLGYAPDFGFFDRYEQVGDKHYKLIDKYRDPELENVLAVTTGGTVCQRRTKKGGTLNPFENGNLVLFEHMPRLGEHANVDIYDAGSIDSTNLLQYRTRGEIAEFIFSNRYDYSGFVVTHGTDSMDVSAATFAFMLQELGKPVVLTGSQFPIFDDPNDARTNLTNGVVSATRPFGEVAVYFGGSLMRGVSVVKIKEERPEAFESPNDKILGEWSLMGDKIKIDNTAVQMPYRSNTDARLFTDFNEDVELVFYNPAASLKSVTRALEAKDCKGVVIGGVGAGNLHTKLLPYVKTFTESGRPVYVTTRCLTGSAQLGAYGPGAEALDVGARSAKNLTDTTATVKLSFAIGRVEKEIADGLTDEKNRLERIEQLMYNNFCGEFREEDM